MTPALKKALAASMAGGALHALALTPWVSGWWAPLTPLAQTVGLVLLLLALSQAQTARQGGLLGWVYGTAWLIGGTGWTFVSLHRYGGLPAWLAALSVLLLSLFLAIYLAMAAAAWVRWRKSVPWADALLWGSLWLLAELARALIFTGFPWAASAYGLIDVSWRALAPWLGVYGVGAVWATGVAYLVAAFGNRPSRATWMRWAGVALMLGSLVWQPGAMPWSFTAPHGKPLTVSLIQGNVPQDEKFVAELQVPMLLWHTQALRSATADLVVAPETAIPVLPQQLPDDYWDSLLNALSQPGRHALFGVPLGSYEDGYTNSVVGVSAATRSEPGGYYRYNKHHLVPFGEFIPWGFRWFVNLMNMPLGDFARGPLVAPSFPVREQWVAPTICYEDLFGEEIAARFVAPSSSPTLFANVSNLAWFGEEVAIFQHLQIARWRSMEFQIPTVRATNTGATVVIDHDGRVTHQLPTNRQGILAATVQGHIGVTPFAWWAGHWGLWPLVLMAGGLVLALTRIVVLRRP
ncbi:MAG: apolipoprotein N-acyltransferase [Aquabacterium sp.]